MSCTVTAEMFHPHDGRALSLTHNQHLAYYGTVDDYARTRSEKWLNEESKKVAVATNDMWDLSLHGAYREGKWSAEHEAKFAHTLHELLNEQAKSQAFIWPAHKASLHLDHNEWWINHESVAEWLKFEGGDTTGNWVSDEQRELAIAHNSVWALQWYPETPVGFYSLMAWDLPLLIQTACEVKA